MKKFELKDRVIIDFNDEEEDNYMTRDNIADALRIIASAIDGGHTSGVLRNVKGVSEIKWERETADPVYGGIKHHILKHDTYELMQQWKANVYDQHTDKDMPKKSGPAMLNEAAAIIDAVKMEDRL